MISLKKVSEIAFFKIKAPVLSRGLELGSRERVQSCFKTHIVC